MDRPAIANLADFRTFGCIFRGGTFDIMNGASTISPSCGIHSHRLGPTPAPQPRHRIGIPMLRWLIFLPFCLLLQDLHWTGEQEIPVEGPTQINREPLVGPALMRQDLLATLACSPIQTFPGNVPWA